VTLHSVYAHKDKSIVEAACRDIVVHTVGARRVLVEVKQVGGRVTLIPHGCPPPNREPPLWNLYGSPHTMIQFGFGFPYKGWEHSVAIVARLKKDYPDVFFTGLMSERWPDVHVRHARELRRLARELDVSEHVGLVLGFQSDPVLDAYLRTNRVGIFPYREQGEHTVYGCSGAARECMAKGLPVVTSTVPLFEDLEGVVPRRNTVEGWADAVAEIFEHGGDLARQDAFLTTRSWPIVARSYLDLLNDA
jgi:glycosyltransferase involved in cell wall biosynthesis